MPKDPDWKNKKFIRMCYKVLWACTKELDRYVMVQNYYIFVTVISMRLGMFGAVISSTTEKGYGCGSRDETWQA